MAKPKLRGIHAGLKYRLFLFRKKRLHYLINRKSNKAYSKMLIKLGVLSGKVINIKEHVFIEDYRSLKIGDHCSINSGVRFYIEGRGNPTITIGNNVQIARDVIFETGMHEIGDSAMRGGPSIGKNIIVGNGTWIGVGAIILPGVSIGEGCMIQAGSVVTKNCKPNCIYGGNPAKVLFDLATINVLK